MCSDFTGSLTVKVHRPTVNMPMRGSQFAKSQLPLKRILVFDLDLPAVIFRSFKQVGDGIFLASRKWIPSFYWKVLSSKFQLALFLPSFYQVSVEFLSSFYPVSTNFPLSSDSLQSTFDQ